MFLCTHSIRTHTSGSESDHAVDDEDGSDSEVSMRCEFVDSMAAESRSEQSDEGATSADSDAWVMHPSGLNCRVRSSGSSLRFSPGL